MTEPPSHPDELILVREAPRRPPVDRIVAAAVLAVLATVVNWGAIVTGASNLRADADQNDYHLLVIEQFSSGFPRPNLSDYRSATGPGYHLALAMVDRFVTHDIPVLRMASAVFTIALLALLAWAAGSYQHWAGAAAVCLPMATSLYVFLSGAWLLPDNLGWLTVLGLMLVAFRESVDEWTFILTAVLLAAAVFVRQINLWPLGVVIAAVVLVPGELYDRQWRRVPTASLAPQVRHDWLRPAGMALLMGMPAVLILAWFYSLWGGLTPPAFQTVGAGPLPPGHSKWEHEGPNFAVPAMVLAVLAATGFFFLALLLPALREVWVQRRRQLWVIVIGVVVGAALALVVQTEYTPPPGPRYSGLWNISAKFPAVAHRSVFMAGMSAAGGLVVAVVFLVLDRRDRWIWLTTWVCFAVAQSANAKAWHKYYEPFCLMMLALAASRVVARHGAPRWAYAGPVALAALLAGVTLSNVTFP